VFVLVIVGWSAGADAVFAGALDMSSIVAPPPPFSGATASVSAIGPFSF